MKSVVDASVRDTLRNLIRQFSQELSFYRELVQNAIDAQSRIVDIGVRWDETARHVEVEVVDNGAGMDRRIIDEELTRLFSSRKEDDRTRIGKFGIGFVSVFAIAPEAVVVETGRAGEHWRVLFHPDLSFERLVLDAPVEGTRVRLIKKMARQDVDGFIQRSRETVRYWCRHAATVIRFDGEPLNEPFDIDSPIKLTVEEQDTRIVVALTDASPAFFGFYNHGLTLIEGHHDVMPGVAFKVNSPSLEHTLTRDNVVQDAHYAAVMDRVRRLVTTQLIPAWLRQLAEAARPDAGGTAWQRLFALGQPQLPALLHGKNADVPLFRCLRHRPLSLAELRRSAVRAAALIRENGGTATAPVVLFDVHETSPRLLETLAERGVFVLEAAENHRVVACLAREGLRPASASTTFMAVREAAETGGTLRGLALDAVEALHHAGVAVGAIHPMEFEDPRAPLFALAPRLTSIAAKRPDPHLQRATPWRFWRRRPHVLLNARHETVKTLASVWTDHAAWAAAQLARLLCMQEGIPSELDTRLTRWALAEHGG